MRTIGLVIAAAVVLTLGGIVDAQAEWCTDGVHALVPWSTGFTTDAKGWSQQAREQGFKVDRNPSGCSEKNPCILVYWPDYSITINQSHGHVAVFYGGSSIRDSNGICPDQFRGKCSKKPDFLKAVDVIHPKANDDPKPSKKHKKKKKKHHH